MPEPERRMWHQLRAERFQGIKFRRQKVIGKFIADFAANAPKVVVEVDGDTHAVQEGYDAARTQYLEDQGYAVIRFSNTEVMENMDGVLTRLGKVVTGLRGCPPPPTPSPKGEGATRSFSPLERGLGRRGRERHDMNLVTVTAPVVGGILGVSLLKTLATPDAVPLLADAPLTSPLLTQIGAFVLGAFVFAVARARMRRSPKNDG